MQTVSSPSGFDRPRPHVWKSNSVDFGLVIIIHFRFFILRVSVPNFSTGLDVPEISRCLGHPVHELRTVPSTRVQYAYGIYCKAGACTRNGPSSGDAQQRRWHHHRENRRISSSHKRSFTGSHVLATYFLGKIFASLSLSLSRPRSYRSDTARPPV